MRKQLLLLLAILLSLKAYSQIKYEKGYFITNDNQKRECLIKNVDWKNNPDNFIYKTSQNSDPQTANIGFVKEFAIENGAKYQRATVDIDRSSENIARLSEVRNPVFNEDELFLKVLVEGKADLYEYHNENITRFFYSTENSDIEQLIFKSYKSPEKEIKRNNDFRQQLWNNLQCPSFKSGGIKNVDYNKRDLVKLFTEYSQCYEEELTYFEKKEKKDLFNLNLRPRINITSLAISNTTRESRNFDFGNKTNFGFGLEGEFILPFNKNKWSVFIEPTYQYFKAENSAEVDFVSGGQLFSEISYSSIEIPTGARHYFFLNNNSKIFVNAAYIFDISSGSSIDFTRDDGSIYNSLEIEALHNWALGIGFKYSDKISLEARYQTSREILTNYLYWKSNYETLSIIFGYSLF